MIRKNCHAITHTHGVAQRDAVAIATVELIENSVGSSALDKALLAAVFAAPMASPLALWVSGADDWIALDFKRKALEEKKRIDDLGNKGN
jgi:hypothetical protein